MNTRVCSDDLIKSIQKNRCFDHPVTRFAVIETHISWVLLTGPYAYKFKKPIDLGFLDFTTLDKRKKYCEEELRLNRRLAPKIYLGVVAITGSIESPKLGGKGTPIEYAVKMKEFDQSALLPHVLSRGELTAEMVDRLVTDIVAFHKNIPKANSSMPYGEPARLFEPMSKNFTKILSLLDNESERERILKLKSFSVAIYARRQKFLERRKSGGYIKECHGDMHLGNMALIDGKVTIFDAVEFNDFLRWIDVMSEIAFLFIDFTVRGRPDLGWRALNGYLQGTGDYEGLSILKHFKIYRALVRAKVALIQDSQKKGATNTHSRYLELAETFAKQDSPPTLFITRGVAGCGKSYISAALAESMGAVVIRSDVERKRLYGVDALATSEDSMKLYSDEANEKTYHRLVYLAERVLSAGYSAIIDATNIQAAHRYKSAELAKNLGLDFVILDVTADIDLIDERITNRIKSGADPSEADVIVMKRQLNKMEPLTEEEIGRAIFIDSSDQKTREEIVTLIEKGPMRGF